MVQRSLLVLMLFTAAGCEGELHARERADSGSTSDAAAHDASTTHDASADAAAVPIDAASAIDAARAPDAATVRDASVPPATNAGTYCPGGNCVHWWNCRVTYQYQYTSGDWDTDFHMADGTPIALPHRSQLTAVYLAGSGFQPEFADLTSGEWVHFNHMHLNSEFGGDDRALGPVQLVSLSDPAHSDHIYPAGWVVGFSGGGTRRTGYLGTDASGNVCTGGHSTAAHFCAVTRPAHSIDYYLPSDGAGCTTPLGWPSALWSMISPGAPGYQNCPSVCTGCGVAHF